MKLQTIVIFGIISTLITEYSQCARILAIFTYPSKSHMIIINPIIDELLERGHYVTTVTSLSKQNSHENYTEIFVEPVDYWLTVKSHFGISSIADLHTFSPAKTMQVAHIIGKLCTKNCFANSQVQKLYHSNIQFDLILMNQFSQEGFLIFAQKFNVPVVYITTFGSWQYLSQIMGHMQPWAHIPHQFLHYDDRMAFLQRCKNVWASLYDLYYRYFTIYPEHESMIQRYLMDSTERIPSIKEMEKRVSLVLINSYTPLNFPAPKPSGIVEIGAIQIQKPKSLAGDIQEFLDDAQDGAIYFSFGSNIAQSDLSEEKYKSILKVLGKLKQRVLWKWETTSKELVPKNIMMKSWFPQTDILAHRNIKLFISHGGLLSSQETVYRGVPMLGIPLYGDQHFVVKIAENNGYGLCVRFDNLTDVSLKWGIHEMLNNPSYNNAVKKLSEIFRDRPRPAIDEAMYWIEYVIRHEGALHMRPSIEHLNWFSYFLLDVVGAFILSLIIVTILLWYIIHRIYHFSSKKRSNKKEN